jgi:hypothetical protein
MVWSGGIVWLTNKNGNTTSRGVGGQANRNNRISKDIGAFAVCVGKHKRQTSHQRSTGIRYRNQTTSLFGIDE